MTEPMRAPQRHRADTLLMLAAFLDNEDTPDKLLRPIRVIRDGYDYGLAISVNMVRAAKGVVKAYMKDIEDGTFTAIHKEVVDAWKPTLKRENARELEAREMFEIVPQGEAEYGSG